MRRLSVLLAILTVVTADACASNSATASGGTAARSRRDPSVIDSAQLWDGNYGTVYDAVTALHADWLLPRGGPTAGRVPELGIWVEGQLRTRPVDYLKTIRPQDIKRLRRLSPTESLHSYSWPWGGLLVTVR